MSESSDKSSFTEKVSLLLRRVFANCRCLFALALLIFISVVGCLLFHFSSMQSLDADDDFRAAADKAEGIAQSRDRHSNLSTSPFVTSGVVDDFSQTFRKSTISSHHPVSGADSASVKGRAEKKPGIRVVESDMQETHLTFSIGEYSLEQVQTDDGVFSFVDYPSARGRLKKPGLPELPAVRSNIIIPAGTIPELVVVGSSYRDVRCASLLPSAGFVSREFSRASKPVRKAQSSNAGRPAG